VEREDKGGIGYVDFIFYPEVDHTADGIILELKVNHTADDAIRQIKERQYALRFEGKIGEKPEYTGRILAVGPQAETACPADARRCPLEGVVTPGLLDCHVHLVSSDLAEEEPISHREMARLVCQGLRNAHLLLSAGVVACRDLGSVRGCSLGIRDAIDQGIVQGPKVLAAGLSISVTAGHGGSIALQCDGPDEMRRGVRTVIRDGADVVKLMASGGVNSPGPEPGPCELTEAEFSAAVEAARAGAAGNGFAVVADEVRNLAGKSSQAAQETTALLSQTVESMDEGVQAAQDTSESMLSVVTQADQMSSLISGIAEYTKQQTVNAEEITHGIEQIADVVQSNVATAEASAAASEELSGQAAMLREMVAKFRLKE